MSNLAALYLCLIVINLTFMVLVLNDIAHSLAIIASPVL